MKRLSLGLLFVLTCGFAAGQVELRAPVLRVNPGDAVAFPLLISDGKNITALQFTVSWDASLLGLRDDASLLPGEALEDHSLGCRRESARVTVVLFSASLSSLKEGKGTVVNLIFQSSGSAAAESASQVQLSDVQAADAEGNRVTVVTQPGSVTLSTQAADPVAGANTVVFPQIANGDFGVGSYITTLILVNRTTTATGGEVSFCQSDGSPMSVRMIGGQTGSKFSFTAPSRGAVMLQTDGTGPFLFGYAQVSGNGPLGGTILFSQLSPGSQCVSESGVGDSRRGTRFSVPLIFVRGRSDTGIAFANGSNRAVDLVLTLRDQAGTAQGTKPVPLAAGQHMPKFASEFFPVLQDHPEFSGSIEVAATAPISAIALKLEGNLLTTFPVIEMQ
ncbi:MAG: cohesin domain-containing protein [Acidobacteriota bacterium]